MLLAEVAQKHVGGIGVGQHRSQITVVDVDPVFHRHIVGHLVAIDGTVKLHPLMGMGSGDVDIVLVSHVDIARTEQAFAGMLLQQFGDPVLHIEAEAAPHPEKREGDAMLLHANGFVYGCLLHIPHVGMLTRLPEPELGNGGQYGRLP